MANISSQAAIGSRTASQDRVLAEITDRLMAEFDPQVDLTTLNRVVYGCRDELRGAPVAALPELIERLARQRMLPTSTTADRPLL
jgi:hypothetical protein